MIRNTGDSLFLSMNAESLLPVFEQHIRRYIALSSEEFLEILPYFELISLKKKELIQTEGQTHSAQYFVLSGCLRMFCLNSKAVELTTDFALERWWIGEQKAYQGYSVSQCAIQAVEDAVILRIHRDSEEKLCNKHPNLLHYFKAVYQKAYAAAQYRNMLFRLYSKEEIFLQFSQNFPEFVQRVPQYLLASYLGLTPEYLSEIRKRNVS